VANVSEWNADRIVDLGGRGEGRVEILSVELSHQRKAGLARDLPAKLAAGKFAGGLAADMDREGRRGIVKELFGVIVGEDDPEVGLERAQPLPDLGRDRAHVLDVRLVLGLGHGEELRGMRQHGAADDGRDHQSSPWWPEKYRPRAGTTSSAPAGGSPLRALL
jgi:hypothetical protein